MTLPGVCRLCRRPVWWNGYLWMDDAITPHLCSSNARSVYNGDDEYSVSIEHNAQRPVSRLYSERRGACVREYRPNAT